MPLIEEILQQSVAALKANFLDSGEALPKGLLEALENDQRQGARDLATRLRTRQSENRAEGQRLRHLLKFESELWQQGFELIAGVDEAGVGPLAGPVVAGAAILPRDYKLRELNDSKKLDEATRDQLAERIKTDCIAWAIGNAEVEEIDQMNIYHAGLLAMRRAIEGLRVAPNFVLVDARKIPELNMPQRGIVRGDSLSASIAAASILAKTTRDAMMFELDRQFPGYGLAGHKGYPTPEHFAALKKLGASPAHRRSFRPVREVLGLDPTQISLFHQD
ncbi:MAG TPA: ribonuclease HII [Blastocatellia bacterium]|nr:ribonuclease HII [Blastocatellia bacterium]